MYKTFVFVLKCHQKQQQNQYHKQYKQTIRLVQTLRFQPLRLVQPHNK